MVRHAGIILGVLALVAGACESAAQPPAASGVSDGAASGGTVGTGGSGTGGAVGTGGAGVLPDSAPPVVPEDAGAISAPDGSLGSGSPDASPGADADNSFGRQACVRGCTIAAPLHCPRSATCISDCQSDFDRFVAQMPQCRPLIETLMSFGALLPISDWQCSSEGKVTLKPGVCQMEGDRAIQCVLGS